MKMLVQTHTIISLECMHHQQTAWPSLRVAEPSRPELQREAQNGPVEAENPEPVRHHHQNLLPGESLSAVFSLLLSREQLDQM